MKNRKRGNRDSSKAGFTIVELLVAIGVFTIATGIIVGVFIEALKTQRRVNDLMSVQNNASIVLEQMSREVRGGFEFAFSNDGSSSCNESAGFFNQLTFMRARNGGEVSVSYRADETSHTIYRSEGTGVPVPVVAENVSVRRLCFRETPIGRGAESSDPWRITLVMTIGPSDPGIAENVLNLQTTVAARLLPSEITP